MEENKSSINSSPDVPIFTDKTNNTDEYKKILKGQHIEDLQKIFRLFRKINQHIKAKDIAKKPELSDRIEHLARNSAFFTLKDRKGNFNSKLPCRLTNPSKSRIGKVNKQKLEKINKIMVQYLNLNQWKNSTSVIKCFSASKNKTDCVFNKFDIREFYPSISEDILKTSLLFANEYQDIR